MHNFAKTKRFGVRELMAKASLRTDKMKKNEPVRPVTNTIEATVHGIAQSPPFSLIEKQQHEIIIFINKKRSNRRNNESKYVRVFE